MGVELVRIVDECDGGLTEIDDLVVVTVDLALLEILG